jgi:hypothetical protein
MKPGRVVVQFASDEILGRKAEALERRAAQADVEGRVKAAERYRRSALTLREQMSCNAKAWFARWNAEAEAAERAAAEKAAAGDRYRADELRSQAKRCRSIACRFNEQEAAREFKKIRARVCVPLNQEVLDVLEELGVSRSGRGLLGQILEEAIYALREMPVTDKHAHSCWPVYFRFQASAVQGQRPRSWARAEAYTEVSAQIQFQLAKAAHGMSPPA